MNRLAEFIRSLFTDIRTNAAKRNRAVLFVVYVLAAFIILVIGAYRIAFSPYESRKLYFYDSGTGKTASERQQVLRDTNSLARIKRAVEAIRNGPVRPQLMRLVPYEANVKNIFVTKEGMLIIDFDENFFLHIEDGRAVLTIESILRTVFANFGFIREVRIVVNEHPIGTLDGVVNLSRAFTREDLHKQPFRKK
ncbi:MAG: GerMN domain-containing protein [Spirochaetes bacterium]|nr:GerMN domain-containing protein [Spirochaetota bacterium]